MVFRRVVGAVAAASCALHAAAFLLPPGAHVSESSAFTPLDPKDQLFHLPCPGCGAAHADATAGDRRLPAEVKTLPLRFTVSDEEHCLQVNGRPFFPATPDTEGFVVHTSAAEGEEAFDAAGIPFRMHTLPEHQASDDGAQVVPLRLEMTDRHAAHQMQEHVAVDVLRMPDGELLILRITSLPPPAAFAHGFGHAGEEHEHGPHGEDNEHHHHSEGLDFHGEGHDRQNDGREHDHHGEAHDHHGEEHDHHREEQDRHGEEHDHHGAEHDHHGPPGFMMRHGKDEAECRLLPQALCHLVASFEDKIASLRFPEHGHHEHHHDHDEEHGEEHHHAHDHEHHEHDEEHRHHEHDEEHDEEHRHHEHDEDEQLEVDDELAQIFKDVPEHSSHGHHFGLFGFGGPRPCAGRKHGSSEGMSPFSEDESPFHHGRPHHMKPYHHDDHHGFVHSFARGLVAVLVPIVAGITVGLTVSLVGLMLGRFITFLWISVVRRGRRGYASVAQQETLMEDGLSGKESTKASFLERADEAVDPLPVYEEAPAYEEKEAARE